MPTSSDLLLAASILGAALLYSLVGTTRLRWLLSLVLVVAGLKLILTYP